MRPPYEAPRIRMIGHPHDLVFSDQLDMFDVRSRLAAIESRLDEHDTHLRWITEQVVQIVRQ